MTQLAWILSVGDQHHVHPKHCTGEVAFVVQTQILGAPVVQPGPVGTVLEF
jgi:hypothetical protein